MNPALHPQAGIAPAGEPQLQVRVGADSDSHWAVEGVGGRGLYMRRTLQPAAIYLAGTPMQLCWFDHEGRLLLEVAARVRDSDAAGVRLQFETASEDTVARIQALSRRRAEVAPASAPRAERADANTERVLSSIRTALGARCRRLLEQAATGLDQIALDTVVEVTGMPARMALERIYSARLAIESEFVSQLQQSWLTGASLAPAAEGPRPSLQLVDDEAMQTWLKRSESARALERVTRSEWQKLRPLLQAVAIDSGLRESACLSVDTILDALVLAFSSAKLEPALQQFLLRLCAHAEILDLNAYYENLRIELQRAGVRATGVAPVTNVGALAPAPPRAAQPARALPGSPQQVSGAPHASPGPSPVSAISTTRRIWSLGQPPPSSSTAVAGAGAGAATLSDDALLGAMRDLLESPAGRTTATEFSERLHRQAALASGRMHAKPDQRQTEAVALMARLQQAIDVDPLLPNSFRTWSRPLLAPILATQLQPEGLGAAGESIRTLFALIEFGSVLCSERNDAQTLEIRAGIERIVGELAGLPRLLPEQIKAACAKLEHLLQRQQRAGNAIEERVVDACIGQQRLVDARIAVHKELGVLFGGRDVPQALAELLGDRLAAFMVLIALRHGMHSSEWLHVREQLEHLDNALRRAGEKQPAIDTEHYLAWIRDLFTQELADTAALQLQLDQLARALRGEPVPWVRYQTPASDTAPITLASGVRERDGKDPLRELDLLQPGNWLAFGAREPRLLKLAWHAPDRSRFVFVSQLGHKADDLTRSQLLSELQNGTARILDEGNASIIERAWRRMLEGLHDELAEQATHDPLTGLLNRKELERRLMAWASAAERAPLSLLWVGVDHLRVLNQTLGMAAGDHGLRQVADLLTGLAGRAHAPGSFAARMAGDEFVLVLKGMTRGESERCASELLEQLAALDLHWEAQRFRVSASIGLIMADESCTAPEALLKDAERACSAAKESGRGRVYVHETDDSRLNQMRETVRWVGRVEQSLETHALLLYGQRAMSLSDGARQGPDYLEVLLRMRTEDGVASPEQFILAAERYGQITAIDRFVLQELTRTLQQATTAHPYRIAFNISARNIVDAGFIEEILEMLKLQPLPSAQLCIELTETAAIQQLAEATASMKRLAESGLVMVLDDFGSGWSSYQYLKRLPFDVVKVDGAFIRDIAHSAEDRALAKSINEIAHLLGKRTVAEHVENQETLDCVREIGFDYAQGYFVARPEPLNGLLGIAGPLAPLVTAPTP